MKIFAYIAARKEGIQYESLAEALISQLLKQPNAPDFVQYRPILFLHEKGKKPAASAKTSAGKMRPLYLCPYPCPLSAGKRITPNITRPGQRTVTHDPDFELALRYRQAGFTVLPQEDR